MGTQPGGTVQPDHASSRDPGHPWGGCPGSMGSARPGPRNQQQSLFGRTGEGTASSRTSQTCAFLRQEWPATPTWIYCCKRGERSGTAAKADMYQHIYIYICTPRHRHATPRCNCMYTHMSCWSDTSPAHHVPDKSNMHILKYHFSHNDTKATHHDITQPIIAIHTHRTRRIAYASLRDRQIASDVRRGGASASTTAYNIIMKRHIIIIL